MLGIELNVASEIVPELAVTVAIDSKSPDAVSDPQPYPFTLPTESSNGLTRSPYANFVCAANAVKVADAVLMIVIE